MAPFMAVRLTAFRLLGSTLFVLRTALLEHDQFQEAVKVCKAGHMSFALTASA